MEPISEQTPATLEPAPQPISGSGRRWLALIPLAFMVATIVVVMLCRVRLLDAPLERDEGEYAYVGQLMLQGVAPYGSAANMKLPGTHAAYALVMAVFGETIRGIHLGLLLVNALCVLLVLFIAKKLFNFHSGLAAAACYAVMSVGPGVDGVWAHATHFVMLFALAGMLLILSWATRPRLYILILSGLSFGVAFVMKQPGILFALFAGLFILYTARRARPDNYRQAFLSLFLFGLAVTIPFDVTCLLLWRAGVFPQFWFWVFTYAARYVAISSLSNGATEFMRHTMPLITSNLGICGLAVWGAMMLSGDKEHRPRTFLVIGFLICSWLAVCPGLYFREHYFILVMPAVAILAAVVASNAKDTPAGTLPLWAVVGGLAYSMAAQPEYLFQMGPQEAVRLVYAASAFAGAIPVGDYIRAHSDEGDSVAVLGSEPEIFFYSHRKSATPYLYIYPLVEPHSLSPHMQQEYIEDVESAKPKFLVFVKVANSWALVSDSPRGLLEWGKQYYEENYDLVGAVEITPEETVAKWDAEATNYRFHSSDYMMVYRRKPVPIAVAGQ